MTAIQAASLPAALLGQDLIAQAKTGSGKTAAFALTLLASLNARRFAVQSLVLCPTRELADQVTTEIRRLARAEDNIKLVTLSGGVPLRGQAPSDLGYTREQVAKIDINKFASPRQCSHEVSLFHRRL